MSAAGQALEALEALSAPADPFAGLPLAEVAAVMGDRSRAYRALRELEAAGWAEQTPAKAWRVTAKASRLSERVRMALNDLGRAYLGPDA